MGSRLRVSRSQLLCLLRLPGSSSKPSTSVGLLPPILVSARVRAASSRVVVNGVAIETVIGAAAEVADGNGIGVGTARGAVAHPSIATEVVMVPRVR